MKWWFCRIVVNSGAGKSPISSLKVNNRTTEEITLVDFRVDDSRFPDCDMASIDPLGRITTSGYDEMVELPTGALMTTAYNENNRRVGKDT